MAGPISPHSDGHPRGAFTQRAVRRGRGRGGRGGGGRGGRGGKQFDSAGGIVLGGKVSLPCAFTEVKEVDVCVKL